MEEKTDYIKLTFRSIKSGTEYYTLDGKDKVLTPIYRKFIKSYDDLNEFEKVYIFSDWLRLTDKLNSIEWIIQQPSLDDLPVACLTDAQLQNRINNGKK